MSKTNIVLIGMPGAGKSTLGVLLSKTLGMPFLDTDLLIQQSEGRLLQDIINDVGINGFLAIEESTLLNVDVEGHVIATGGSAIYSSKAVEQLKKNSKLIYLKLKFSQIEKRIQNISSRGIVISKDQSLQDLFNERAPLYEANADIIINCSGKHIEDVISLIKEKFAN